MPKPDFKFHTSLRVRWMECDAQGIVFNGAYMGYLEVGQAEYFRNLGFSIYRLAQREYFDTAVARTVLEFKAPARLDDVLDLYLRVVRIGTTSFTLAMEIYPEGGEALLTTAEAVYVGFYPQSGATRPVPDELRQLLDHFEATGEVLPLGRFPRLAAAAALPSPSLSSPNSGC